MNVIHLSTSDLDGGAAKAAYRLHCGLQVAGCSSTMLVRAKQSADKTVAKQQSLITKVGPILSGLPVKLSNFQPQSQFSAQWFPARLPLKVNRLKGDLIHLHWICNG